jgi:hypothetical protein
VATSLVTACLLAFAGVFVVLGTLAACIRLLTLLFPSPEPPAVDASVAAALAATVAVLRPGARLTHIVEET